MIALAFTLLRSYVLKKDLLHENISKNSHIKIKKKNIFALVLYLTAALTSMISVYISFVLLLIVPAMYFIPEKITPV
jgi:hypothetical protein